MRFAVVLALVPVLGTLAAAAEVQPDPPKPRPDEIAIIPDAAPTSAQKDVVLTALARENFRTNVDTGHDLAFGVGEADLNGDGRPDLIAHLFDVGWCGSGGCAGIALLATESGYQSNRIRLANFDSVLLVREISHGGMQDLRFDDAQYIFHWTGTKYE